MNGSVSGAGRDLTVRLDNFEGPLDLLLYLIRKEEVSIRDIPIARIAEQYLAYIADLSEVEIDRAADFLVMAATLLDIKARMLLPRPPRTGSEAGAEEAGEAEEDPRAELARQLEAYQRFKELAAELRRREEAAGRSYPRGGYPDLPRGPAPLVGVSLLDLVAAFRAVVEARGAWREVPRETVTLRDKLKEILDRLGRSPDGVRFRSLFRPGAGRLEVLVTFLALLELVRQRRARAVQERPFAEILILPAPQSQGGMDRA